MSGGRRTQRISKRDVEVLRFIARFGVLPRSAVSDWAQTGQTATLGRERRLREAGLIEVSRIWGEAKLVAATMAGLRLSGCEQLGRAVFSFASVRHDAAVAEVAARLEREGRSTLSEREIAASERASGARLLSARLGERRFHRCDLIVVGAVAGAPEAIEVELSAKGSDRLEEILRSWRRAVGEGRFSQVVYRCSPATLPVVLRAVERTRTDKAVKVEELWH